MKQNNISYTVKKVFCILLLIVFCSWAFLMMLQSLYDVIEYGGWLKITYDACNLICGILMFICVLIINKKSVKHIINTSLGMFDIGICIFIVNSFINVINAIRYYDVDDYRYILFAGISDIIMHWFLFLIVSALIINLTVKRNSGRTSIIIVYIALIICIRPILLALINKILIDRIDSLFEILLANFINEVPKICLCISLFLLTSLINMKLPKQFATDDITVDSMNLKSQNESGMLSNEDYSEKERHILDALDDTNETDENIQQINEKPNKRMKKGIIWIIAVFVTIIVVIITVISICFSGSRGLEYELSSDAEYYIVSGIGDCTDTTITIPSRYKWKPVKAIGNEAFEGSGL